MTWQMAAGWFLAAFFGGAGLGGLVFLAPRHYLEQRLRREDARREALNKRLALVDELAVHRQNMDRAIGAIQTENTLQCYCILACLKGLEEQGCDGPVHDGIARMERYLNQKAHGREAA